MAVLSDACGPSVCCPLWLIVCFNHLYVVSNLTSIASRNPQGSDSRLRFCGRLFVNDRSSKTSHGPKAVYIVPFRPVLCSAWESGGAVWSLDRLWRGSRLPLWPAFYLYLHRIRALGMPLYWLHMGGRFTIHWPGRLDATFAGNQRKHRMWYCQFSWLPAVESANF